MPAEKVPAREAQLGYAPSAIRSFVGARADEVGTTASEPATQMDNGNDLGHGFPSSDPDPHGIGKMQTLSLRA